MLAQAAYDGPRRAMGRTRPIQRRHVFIRGNQAIRARLRRRASACLGEATNIPSATAPDGGTSARHHPQ
jgi:hypothetical protein